MTLLKQIMDFCKVRVDYTLWEVNYYNPRSKKIVLNIPTLLGIMKPIQLLWGRPLIKNFALAHELGHAFVGHTKLHRSPAARRLFGNFRKHGQGTAGFVRSIFAAKKEGFATRYGVVHPEEDFADCFALLVLNENKIPSNIEDSKVVKKMKFIQQEIARRLK